MASSGAIGISRPQPGRVPAGWVAAGLAAAAVVLGCLLAAGRTTPTGGGHPAAVAGYGKLPLSFQPNRGQSGGGVRFLATGPGFGLYLTRDGATVGFRDADVSMRFVGGGTASI